jgi:hypothetical protein
MIHIICIYLLFNAFMFGCCWEDLKSDKLWYKVGMFLMVMTIGATLHIIALLAVAYRWVMETFQIKFLFLYFFTKKYHNPPAKFMREVNQIAISKGNSPRDRIYRWCVKLLNKRVTPKTE